MGTRISPITKVSIFAKKGEGVTFSLGNDKVATAIEVFVKQTST